MSDLISRQDAIKAFYNPENGGTYSEFDDGSEWYMTSKQIYAVLEALPSADAVEVVRCKDCKHRDPEDKKCDCGMWHFPYITDDNDYCSYGERREP